MGALPVGRARAARHDPGRHAGRLERFTQAIAVDPELGQAWRTLAKAYARAKDRPALEQLGRDYAARFGQP